MTDKPTTTPMPTVHLNGTSHKMLTEGYEEAHYTLGLFTKSFHNTEFNSRDYYVQGPEAWPAAVDARIEINQKIKEISQYLEEHMGHLADQAPKN
jgi:hypothetical protein